MRLLPPLLTKVVKYLAVPVLVMLYVCNSFAQPGIEVFMKEEALNENNISKPRIYIKNNGSESISDIKAYYYITAESGKTPIVDEYSTPSCEVTIEQVSQAQNDIYRIIYDYAGITIGPGEVIPSVSGNIVGIHYPDWSDYDKTNDYSNNQKNDFELNNNIPVYNSQGSIVFGNEPDMGPSGENKEVEVFLRDEALNEHNITKPRIYIKNMGVKTIEDLYYYYYFSVQDGKEPVLEDYYTPECGVSLEEVGDGVFRIKYDYSGVLLQPGDILPNQDGNVVGIHYNDWSEWDKTDDGSFNNSSDFMISNNIPVYEDGYIVGGDDITPEADIDNDGVPGFVEEILGFDPDDDQDKPEAVIPSSWSIDKEIRNTVDYDYSVIDGYSSDIRCTFWEGNFQHDISPIVSVASSDSIGLPDIPANYSMVGEIFDITTSGRLQLPLAFPDNVSDAKSERFFKLYHYSDQEWEEKSIDYMTDKAVYFSSDEFSPYAIAATEDAVVFVDESNSSGGDGTSWDNAFTTLREALDVATSGQEIWVAEGSYYPTSGTNRDASFNLLNGVRILGGFPAGGGAEFERDHHVYKTILSGDIGVKGDKTDNTYSVVSACSGAELNGVTVKDGYNVNGYGAGIVMENESGESFVLKDCRVADNTGARGTAIYIVNSPALIDNCIIEENSTNEYAVVAVKNTDEVDILSSTFEENINGNYQASALFYSSSNANIQNCVFSNNQTNSFGGTVEITNNSAISDIIGCTFYGNSGDAQANSIAFGCEAAELNITNCIFWNETGAANTIWANNGVINFDYNDIEGGEASISINDDATLNYGSNNISDDPVFANASEGDLHLGLNSPCIAAGYENDDIGGIQTGIHFKDVTYKVGLKDYSAFRVAIADINQDGFPDLLIHERPNEDTEDVYKKSRLLLNVQEEGSSNPHDREFKDVTEESNIWENRAGTDEGRHSSGAVISDVDNDGDMDIYFLRSYHKNVDLASKEDVELMINDGSGTFHLSETPISENISYKLNNSAASFTDYNLDGNLDLLLGHWFWFVDGEKVAREDNVSLLTGNGNGTFSLNPDITGYSAYYAVAVADANGSVYPDLFAPTYRNGSTPAETKHWKNQGGVSFTDISADSDYGKEIGFGTHKASFGSMPRDYDNDGDVDFLEIITHGDEYKGSTVLTNDGTGKFSWDFDKIVGRSQTDEGMGHHGDHYASWFDIDNDGLSDFIITECGYGNNGVYIFKQSSDNTFENVTEISGHITELNRGNGMPSHTVNVMDYDKDGDEDILLGFSSSSNIRLYSNETSPKNNWIGIKLKGDGVTTNSMAVGAKVEVKVGTDTYTQYVYAGYGQFGSQNPAELHFGIGEAEEIDEIVVTWPNSSKDQSVIPSPEINQRLVIQQ